MRDRVTFISLNKERTLMSCSCIDCGKEYTWDVEKQKAYDWMNRNLLVQNAFPEIDRKEREVLISGKCPECWDKMFSIPSGSADPDDDLPESEPF